MEIVGTAVYNHKKEDCPSVLGMALRQKYNQMPDLGIMVPDDVLIKRIKTGLDKHGCTLNQLYESHTDFINKKQITKWLKYFLKNKRDGYMVLEHNNPVETRHLLGFLYNHENDTLDFFDSYNNDRFFYTMRMNPSSIHDFIEDTFHKYFKDEFVIEFIYEINQS